MSRSNSAQSEPFRLPTRSEDTSENAIADLKMDNGRHTNPVFHGDTIYAESTVSEKRDSHRSDAGVVEFKLVGKRPEGQLVCDPRHLTCEPQNLELPRTSQLLHRPRPQTCLRAQAGSAERLAGQSRSG
jgi:hypothetical protein